MRSLYDLPGVGSKIAAVKAWNLPGMVGELLLQTAAVIDETSSFM
jgi:hypothetical protein